jgi:hydroxymethylbilane synthase
MPFASEILAIKTQTIIVGARSSPLSQAQLNEVLKLLNQNCPYISFKPLLIKTYGDLDLNTSLRNLEKTDFFTKEVDELLLAGECQIAIHSAKDLPEPLPKALTVVALTKGLDPSDCLVLRKNESFERLPFQAIIATSSLRRELAVKQMRPDLRFIDLRGTIHQRLQKLKTGEADGVVIAEAALIRLGLTFLNRISIPGETTPYQGKLAILARTGDEEMVRIFASIDSRNL